MPSAAVCVSIFYELGQLLRRRVWQPLRRMMEIFHVLPLTAAILVFLLLAYNGQLREIYISYLESLNDPEPGQVASAVADSAATAAGFAAALAGFALISAILCEAHYWLSTMRINVVYSSLSNPESGSMLRRVQRWAAIGLALVPWLGVAAGLFRAKDYLAEIYPQLQTAGIDPGQIKSMQELLPKAGIPSITLTTIFFALVVGFVVDRYRRHAVVQSVVIGATPFAAISLFLLLTDLHPEKLDGFQKAGAGLAVVLASAAYYVAYYRLHTMRRGFIYAHPLNPDTGINRQRRRRIALFACAAFPWLVIALYFAIPPCCLEAVADQTATWSPFPTFQSLPVAGRWAIFPVAMTWVTATGLIVATLLDSFRERRALQRMIIVSIAVLMIGASTASWLTVDAIVQLYRLLGPLGSMSVELLFVLSMFTLLAVLSQQSGFPALTLVLLAIVVSALFPISINVIATALMIVCATLAVMALLSRLWAVAIVAALVVVPGIITWMERSRSDVVSQNSGPVGPALNESFRDWLRLRPDAAAYTGRSSYPVFIIAVEGGGIYASAAASLFLAGLEDSNPGFSQHVFAISGVSGGAIGAAVFQALDHAMFGPAVLNSGRAADVGALPVPAGAPSPSNECGRRDRWSAPPATRHPLSPIVSKIMQDDHFSPVVGAIFPDLLGASALGRPQALAGSFRNSVNSKDSDAARELGNCFVDHWSASSQAPALVLNATWAETGFRVAFSPFLLHGDDDSLYSFWDKNMPDTKKVTLIDAAVVSARFPGILPPFSVTMKANDRELRWNFVDGGYSDSTGSGTALALYRALKTAADAGRAEIKILLLTGSNPQPDLTPSRVSISGTEFRDTLAPIAAVMKVREGLGNQAVARVCEEFHLNRDCRRQSNDPKSPLKIVGINDELYGLPLGWKLSHTTFEVVRQMLGDPRRCEPEDVSEKVSDEASAPEEDYPPLSKQTFRSNSCVLKFIAELLSGEQPDRQ
jgi:hypothetical protein